MDVRNDTKVALDTARVDPVAPDLAKLAHELRTPLSAIAALAEIVRDERLGALGSPRYQSYAAGIHDSAMHALSVISGYLDCGQSARGTGLPMDFVELDLAGLVAASVSALTPLADRAGLKIAAEIPSGLPLVIADRRSVQQIVNNLVANALKFTPPGGVIKVRLDYALSGPIVLEVIDTGDGMTSAELTRARAGASAPEPLRRRSGSTGYGLPLVRALAVALGAAFKIESELRQGTRVSILFPHDRLVPV